MDSTPTHAALALLAAAACNGGPVSPAATQPTADATSDTDDPSATTTPPDDATSTADATSTTDPDTTGATPDCNAAMCGEADGCCPDACAAVDDADCASTDTSVIPPDRRIPWDPGIPGGIPERTEVCGSADAFGIVGDGVTDDAPAIQAMLDACGADMVAVLPAGRFRLGSGLRMRPHVSLRGAGIGATVLVYDGSDDAAIEFREGSYDYDFANSAIVDVTGGNTKGSDVLELANAVDWQSGDYVVVDDVADGDTVFAGGQSGDCTWCGREGGTRPMGQLTRVIAVDGTTLTIEPALYADFPRAPQVARLTGAIEWAGLESLSVDNSSSAARDTVVMEASMFSWLSEVELVGSRRRHIWAYGGFRNEIRRSVLHTGSAGYESDHAYGIFLGSYATAWLIEDNIFHTLLLGIAMEGAVSGNVIAYNYATNAQHYDPEWPGPALAEHGPHSMMNLVEGNWFESKVMADNYWGSASHNTYWRNRVLHQPDRGWVYGTWAFDVMATHYHENLVGNVVGTPGYETIRLAQGTDGIIDARVAFKFGYQAISGGGSAEDHDARSLDTAILHGNWDSVDEQIAWDDDIAEHSLPPSLFRAAAPTWFGDVPWPPLGPDVDDPTTLREHELPAMARYVGP